MAEVEELWARAMNRKDVDSFAYGVLAEEGIEGWIIEWSKCSPGLCIHDLKKILVDLKYIFTQPLWFAFEHVLHEIAHIRTYKGFGFGHTPEFFSEYARLVDKYLGCNSR